MPGLNLEAWRLELATDPDREFVLNGVINGFDIVDKDVHIVSGEVANHPSASPEHGNYEAVKQQVLSEISDGNYVVCDNKPLLISPLGAIPKPPGGVHLIHDCSRPVGNALNDHATLDCSQKFETLDDATSLICQSGKS